VKNKNPYGSRNIPKQPIPGYKAPPATSMFPDNSSNTAFNNQSPSAFAQPSNANDCSVYNIYNNSNNIPHEFSTNPSGTGTLSPDFPLAEAMSSSNPGPGTSSLVADAKPTQSSVQQEMLPLLRKMIQPYHDKFGAYPQLGSGTCRGWQALV